MLGKPAYNMFVDVTAGVDPAAVDTRAIAAELSYDTVTAVKSGLDILWRATATPSSIANATCW
jgi:hypothetical protein